MILCRARVGMPPRSPGIGVLLVHQVPESPQAPRIELAGCSTRRHRGRGRRPIRSGCCPRIVVTACGYLGDDGRSTGGRSTIRRPRFGRPWSGRSVFWLTRFGRLRFGRSRFGRGCRWIRAHGVRSGCGWVAVGGGRSVVVGRWWSVGGGRSVVVGCGYRGSVPVGPWSTGSPVSGESGYRRPGPDRASTRSPSARSENGHATRTARASVGAQPGPSRIYPRYYTIVHKGAGIVGARRTIVEFPAGVRRRRAIRVRTALGVQGSQTRIVASRRPYGSS